MHGPSVRKLFTCSAIEPLGQFQPILAQNGNQIDLNKGPNPIPNEILTKQQKKHQ